ncbi:MAG: glycosyltransferase family 4 protein [Kiritimatiellia bacterium]
MTKKCNYKILWIDVVAEPGGAQHSMFEVCRKLSEEGITVEIAIPYGVLYDRFHAAGFTIYPISPIRASKKGIALFKTVAKLLKAPHTINQIIRVSKPDIVHTNSLSAFLTTTHVSAATPIIWHVRDLQPPSALIRPALHRAVRMITASEAIDEHFTDMLSPRHRGKLRLIRNGIDSSAFESADKVALRANCNLPTDRPVIGMVAHLIPWKKHDVFIEAAALIKDKIPEAHFAIFGKDLFNENQRYIKQLQDLIAEKGLESSFTWISDIHQPERIIPALDLLIHPARREPFGRIICEAMAAKVPVVAADTGGPSTIIIDYHSGRLASGGSAEQFAAIAVELLTNHQVCAVITANALLHVRQSYTIARVCDQLIHLYDEIYQAAKSRREFKPDKY